MPMRRVFLVLSLIALMSACGQPNAPSGAPGPSAPASEVATTAPGFVATSAPAACDAPATPIATGVDISGEIAATRAPYPANARYYCFSLPEGASQATLRLSGLSADLDLYVGHGSITTVQGVDVSAGQTYQWKSNAFGTVDETVTITQPAAGVYYAEIVSYEGQHSPFVFSVR